MKHLTLVFLSCLFLSVPVFAQEAPAHDITVKVEGLVCDFCARAIEKVFSTKPAVEDVDVNLDTHEVTLDLKENQTIPDEDITKSINDAGYTVVEITRK